MGARRRLRHLPRLHVRHGDAEFRAAESPSSRDAQRLLRLRLLPRRPCALGAASHPPPTRPRIQPPYVYALALDHATRPAFTATLLSARCCAGDILGSPRAELRERWAIAGPLPEVLADAPLAVAASDALLGATYDFLGREPWEFGFAPESVFNGWQDLAYNTLARAFVLNMQPERPALGELSTSAINGADGQFEYFVITEPEGADESAEEEMAAGNVSPSSFLATDAELVAVASGDTARDVWAQPSVSVDDLTALVTTSSSAASAAPTVGTAPPAAASTSKAVAISTAILPSADEVNGWQLVSGRSKKARCADERAPTPMHEPDAPETATLRVAVPHAVTPSSLHPPTAATHCLACRPSLLLPSPFPSPPPSPSASEEPEAPPVAPPTDDVGSDDGLGHWALRAAADDDLLDYVSDSAAGDQARAGSAASYPSPRPSPPGSSVASDAPSRATRSRTQPPLPVAPSCLLTLAATAAATAPPAGIASGSVVPGAASVSSAPLAGASGSGAANVSSTALVSQPAASSSGATATHAVVDLSTHVSAAAVELASVLSTASTAAQTLARNMPEHAARAASEYIAHAPFLARLLDSSGSPHIGRIGAATAVDVLDALQLKGLGVNLASSLSRFIQLQSMARDVEADCNLAKTVAEHLEIDLGVVGRKLGLRPAEVGVSPHSPAAGGSLGHTAQLRRRPYATAMGPRVSRRLGLALTLRPRIRHSHAARHRQSGRGDYDHPRGARAPSEPERWRERRHLYGAVHVAGWSSVARVALPWLHGPRASLVRLCSERPRHALLGPGLPRASRHRGPHGGKSSLSAVLHGGPVRRAAGSSSWDGGDVDLACQSRCRMLHGAAGSSARAPQRTRAGIVGTRAVGRHDVHQHGGPRCADLGRRHRRVGFGESTTSHLPHDGR